MATGPRRRHARHLDFPGAVHFLTFSCFQRRAFLRHDRAATWFLDAVTRARREGLFELWAYMVMPDHVHLVVRPAARGTVGGILSGIKLPVTRKSLHWAEQRAPAFVKWMIDQQPNGQIVRRFWQRGPGYDRCLRSDEDVHEKIAYLHHNPVRRGLVSHPGEWPWSSWRAWHLGVDEPIPIDRSAVPPRRG